MKLFNFHLIRPPYEEKQEAALEWFAEAHARAERCSGKSEGEAQTFHQEIRKRLWHVGCKPDRIAKRASVLEDYLHRNWEQMTVFQGLDARMKVFAENADRVFEEFYEGESSAPEHLIHVTCTGYVSPSGAQKLVAKRSWKTTVTHAYHMGCYGSIPALRMASGFSEEGRVDIVHTEMCSLHSNMAAHQTDQLVVQSLFADGFIKYSAGDAKEGLLVRGTLEELIPNSAKAMTWGVGEMGFRMALAKEVVVHIARALGGYLERLAKKTRWTVPELCGQAVFAIHPGGPKILFQVQELFGLKDWQIEPSVEVLKRFGNMSSATLPHIWKQMLEDESVKDGTPIVSLAFGPGLTIAGAILEKICGGQR